MDSCHGFPAFPAWIPGMDSGRAGPQIRVSHEPARPETGSRAGEPRDVRHAICARPPPDQPLGAASVAAAGRRRPRRSSANPPSPWIPPRIPPPPQGDSSAKRRPAGSSRLHPCRPGRPAGAIRGPEPTRNVLCLWLWSPDRRSAPSGEAKRGGWRACALFAEESKGRGIRGGASRRATLRALALALLCGLFAPVPAQAAERTLLVLGDSLGAGFGLPAERRASSRGSRRPCAAGATTSGS